MVPQPSRPSSDPNRQRPEPQSQQLNGNPPNSEEPPQKSGNKTPIVVLVAGVVILALVGGAAYIVLNGGNNGPSRDDTPEDVVQKYIDGPVQDFLDGDHEAAWDEGLSFFCPELQAEYNDEYETGSALPMRNSMQVDMEVKGSEVDGDSAMVDVKMMVTSSQDVESELSVERFPWQMRKEDGVWRICDPQL